MGSTSGYVSGGNVSGLGGDKLAKYRFNTKLQKILLFSITGITTVAATIMLFLLLSFMTTANAEAVSVAGQSAGIQIDHALARGTSLNTILTHPSRYTAGVDSGIKLNVTRGSCGQTRQNAYTLTATDARGYLYVFTTKGDQFTTGKVQDLAALLRDVCRASSAS